MTGNSSALINGTNWDSASEIWTDEITDTVTQSGGVTTIEFTRLTSLPSYYSDQVAGKTSFMYGESVIAYFLINTTY